MENSIAFVGDEEEFEGRKIVLMDLEGTLTPGKRYLPEDPSPEDYRKLLNGKEVEGDVEVGYWSGLHLLTGEKPSDYFKRVENWQKNEISLEEFEGKNIRMWNSLVEDRNHDSAPDLINWYNRKYLDLRDESKDLVREFQESGYLVGILSHTSKTLSKLAAKDTGADFVVTAWKFSFEQGKFAFTEKKKYADEKAEIISEMRSKGAEKIVFVGNGENDVNISEGSDRGYLVENKDKLDYGSVDAFTGEFEEIFEKIKGDLESEER